MATRKIGQKTSLVVAYLCYVGAVGVLLYAWYWNKTFGSESPIFASILAVIVFLLSCGAVRHVIGKVNLPDLSIKSLKK